MCIPDDDRVSIPFSLHFDEKIASIYDNRCKENRYRNYDIGVQLFNKRSTQENTHDNFSSVIHF